MKARINSLTYDRDGNPIITVTVVENKTAVEKTIDQLDGKDINVEFKQYHKMRTRDANSYAWVLIGKIAEAVNASPADVYQQMIRDIGGNYEVVAVRNDALAQWRYAWTSKGVGWMIDIVNANRTDGYTDVMCWYGSSAYNSRQMAALIDRIIDEAKEYGIETLTPFEIEKINKLWECSKNVRSI